MRQIILILIALLPPSGVLAADVGHGQRLHDQHCVSCHRQQYGGDGSQMYLRPERLIHSPQALDKRIAMCNKMTRAGLSPDDERDISAYLARDFYRFSP